MTPFYSSLHIYIYIYMHHFIGRYKKIPMPHGHFSDFIALCILHYQALIGKLLKFLQVYSGSYKNLDNDFTGC